MQNVLYTAGMCNNMCGTLFQSKLWEDICEVKYCDVFLWAYYDHTVTALE